MTVLIFAPESDLHAGKVIAALEHLGKPYFLWHQDLLLTDSKLSFNILGGQLSELRRGEQRLALDSVSSVWWRRPGSIRVGSFPAPWIDRMVEWESSRALMGILRTLNCHWVNHPGRQNEALHKVWQLDAARQCGFNVPRSLLTNDPEAAREFVGAAPQQYVYKLIDEASWRFFPANHGPRGLPTMPLRACDLDKLDQVAYSMHLLQEKVDKECDLRVTVVGEKIFAARIESQLGQGALDFRLDYSVPMVPFALADEIAENCLRLTRMLGLEFGAIDLALSEEGQYFFFEINPAGQYLWIEDALSMPISDELARLLVR